MTHRELKSMADKLVDILGDAASTSGDRAAAHTALVSVVDQIEASWQERIDVRDELLQTAEERILSLETELYLIKRLDEPATGE